MTHSSSTPPSDNTAKDSTTDAIVAPQTLQSSSVPSSTLSTLSSSKQEITDEKKNITTVTSSTSTLNAQRVHQAFCDLMKYAHEKQLGALFDISGDLTLKTKLINDMFPEQVKFILEINNLSKSKLDSKNEALLELPNTPAIRQALGGSINSLIETSESCGDVANFIAALFLGPNAEQLKPNRQQLPSFIEYTQDKQDDTLVETMTATMTQPQLARYHLTRDEAKRQVDTHSYCTLYAISEERSDLESYLYQAYYGNYGVSEWLQDPKAAPMRAEDYFKLLSDLVSSSQTARMQAYGLLYRKLDTETEVPKKEQLHLRYKLSSIDLEIAYENITSLHKNLKQVTEEIEKAYHVTPLEHMRNLCWSSIASIYTQESINRIRPQLEREETAQKKQTDAINTATIAQNSRDRHIREQTEAEQMRTSAITIAAANQQTLAPPLLNTELTITAPPSTTGLTSLPNPLNRNNHSSS